MILLHMLALVVTLPLLMVTVDSKAQQCTCSEVKQGSDEYVTVCRTTACIPEGRPKLQLQGTGISSLSRESLGASHKLRFLSIQGTSLESLPVNLLAGAKGLEYLEISYNSILKVLPEELLWPLDKLEVLVLKNLTSLTKLPKRFLATNAHLKKLIIQNVPNLVELDLHILRFSSSLEELVVSGTSVDNLDLQGIPSAISLHTLDLSQNHLRELPLLADLLQVTHKLNRLSLSGNRWDCSRLWQQGLLKALSGSGILFDNGAECSDPQPCAGTALTSPIVQKCLKYSTQHNAGGLMDIFTSILSESADAPTEKWKDSLQAPVDDLYVPGAAKTSTRAPQDLSDSDADALFAVLGDVLNSPPSHAPPPQRHTPPPPPPPRPRPNPSEELAAVLPKLEQTLKDILESTDAAEAPAPPPPRPTPTPNLHDLEKTLSALLPLLRDIVRNGVDAHAPKTPPPATKSREKVAALSNLLDLLQKASRNDFADVQLLMSECEDDPGKSAAKGGRREVFVNVGAIFHSDQPLCSKI